MLSNSPGLCRALVMPDDCLQCCKRLRDLKLSHNLLEVVPSCLSSATNLQSLDLSNNMLTSCLTQVGQLTMLSMDSCNLAEIPHAFFSLSSLKMLSLKHNMIREIPSALPWQSLHRLYMIGNWPLMKFHNSFLEELSVSSSLELNKTHCTPCLLQVKPQLARISSLKQAC